MNSIQTPLFNPLNLTVPSKINSVIRDNFNEEFKGVPSELTQYVSEMQLVDILDFKQSYFDAQIKIIKKIK